MHVYFSDKRPASDSADQPHKRLRKELPIHDSEGKLWEHEVNNPIHILSFISSSWKQKGWYGLVLYMHFWRQSPCYPLCVDSSFWSVKWDMKFTYWHIQFWPPDYFCWKTLVDSYTMVNELLDFKIAFNLTKYIIGVNSSVASW